MTTELAKWFRMLCITIRHLMEVVLLHMDLDCAVL